MTGILVLDKTAGVTSFDAVALVRRRLGLKRVGHAGTLDPEATGVLPILLGEATKLMPYLADQDKEYVATLRLGVTTDTGDLSGRVTATAPVPALGRDEVEAACRPFVGRIKQVPPMYSAVHHGGRRLYELAREGQEVVREPREVVIHAIEVEEAAGDSVLPWPALAEGPSTEVWARVQAADAALAGWPAVRLDSRAAAQLEHGQTVSIAPPGAAAGTLVRVHAADGRLLGVGEVLTGGRTRPVRMLHADRPGTRVLPG